MNPLAVELNEIIEAHSPAVMRMLSDLGRGCISPKASSPSRPRRRRRPPLQRDYR